jgi:hypothetical protein
MLAGRVNRFLGTGWDGARMLHGEPDGGLVYLDPVLWEEWRPQIEFLVTKSSNLQISNLQVANQQIVNPRVGVFAWPYGEWQGAWALLPEPSEITFEEGPLSQGDRDPQPFTTYLAFFASPAEPDAPAVARFEGGVELLGVAVTPMDAGATPGGDGGGIGARLRWRATAPLMEDYAVFVHYLRDGERIAQADSRPAGGHYPTTVWRPGDAVNDDHWVKGVEAPLPGRDVLRFGLWQPESGEVLYLLDEVGNPAGDWIEVPVRGW